MLLEPFIRLKRLKEILVQVKSKQHRKELIEIARITINQLNRVREGEVRATLDNKLSQNVKEVSNQNIERTIEEIAEEESSLTKREEEQGVLYEPPNQEIVEGFYGKIDSDEKAGDFYKSEELNVFYEAPEEDKKEKRFYF